jgi:hypothetical protein
MSDYNFRNNVYWFSGPAGTVGIVRVFDEYGNTYKYYISSVSGLNEEQDFEYICFYGVTFPTEAGDALFDI